MTKYIFLSLFFVSTLMAQNLEKISLQLHWLDQFEFAGYYMAKEKGYYKDAGFDVELRNYSYGLNVVDEVDEGKATFAIGGSDLIIEISQGKKLKLISSIFQSSPLVLVSTPKSDIKNVSDFKNKNIMITPDAISSVTLNAMMQKERVSMNDLIKQEHSFDIKDLINGTTDLMQSYISNEPYQLQKRGIKPTIFDPKEYGFDFYSDILFTSEHYYKNNPQKIEDFKEATLKGWQYAFDNIQESVDILYNKYNIQKRSKEALLYEAKELKKLAFIKDIPLGDINTIKLQRMYDVYNLMNLVQNPIDINNIIIKRKKQITLTQKEKEFIKKHPKLTLGYSPLSAPVIIKKENQEERGMGVDLAKIIYQQTGLEFSFIDAQWNKIVNDSKNKKIDGFMVSVSKSKNRAKYFNFSKPYMTQTPIVFVKVGNQAKYRNIKSLKNKKMAILKGVEAMEETANKIGAQKLYYNTIEEVIKSVISNESDFSIFFENIFYLAQGYGLNYIELAFPLKESKEVFFSISKEYPEAISIINKVLDTFSDNELLNMKNKWFTSQDTVKKQIVLNNNEKEYLKNNAIRMCVDPDWEPYEKIDKDGDHVGMVADFLALIEQRINTKLTLVKTDSWDESLLYKKENKCDILSFLNKTPQRSEYLNFTDTLYNEPEVIVARNDITYISGFKGLHNKTIGIVKGYQLEEYLRTHHSDIKLIYVKNKKEGLEKVSNGEIYATVNALMGGAYLISKYNLANIKIAGETGRMNQYRIGVDKNNTILLNILNKAVQSILESEKEKIVSQWVSVKLSKEIDYAFLYKIFAVIFVLVLYGLYRYYQSIKINRLIQSKNELLEAANQKANNAVKAKSQFMANISHEIRTPLGGIIGLTELLLKTPLNDIQKDYLLKTKSSSILLLNVINDILDSSKIEAGKFSIEKKEFLLQDIINDIQKLFDHQMNDKDIRFDINVDQNIPSTLIGDETRIRQILNNLLSNAYKFTKEGEITLYFNIKKIEDENITLLIKIKDTGIGISQENQKKIFQAYEQIDAQDRRLYGGTGLGLQITKQLVSLMGGEIELTSKEGVGSSFSFTIKVQKSTKTIQATKKDIKKRFSLKGKILLVEDNEINQVIIQEGLREYSLEIDIAHNGKQALEFLEKKEYDLIFMDLHMPIMNGFEATKRIREFDKEIPIIALSASAMEKDKQITSKFGMNDHLSKPINWDNLEEILKKYLPVNEYDDTRENRIFDIFLNYMDFEAFKKKFESNPETGYFILDFFAEKYSHFNDDILKIKENKDELYEYIHSLKGASGNIFALNIFRLCSSIKKESSYDENKITYQLISQELDYLVDEIKKSVSPKLQNNNSFDQLEFIKELKSLMAAISEDDFVSIQRFSLFIKTISDICPQETLSKLDSSFKENNKSVLLEELEKLKTIYQER